MHDTLDAVTFALLLLVLCAGGVTLGWYLTKEPQPHEVVIDVRPCQGHPAVWLSCSEDGTRWERVRQTCDMAQWMLAAQTDPRCRILRMEMDK